MHTIPFSTDSEMSIDEVLSKKAQLGLDVVLTEHMDIDFPGSDYFGFEPSEYFQRYLPLRNDGLLLGVEVGLLTNAVEKNQEFVSSHPFDMVIGSIHAVHGFDIYYQEYYDSFPDKKSSFEAYLQTMIENVKAFDNFDVLGHIDYICRQAPYEDKELHYEEFPDYIDEILKTLIERRQVLELNTRRLGNPVAIEALTPLYRRYYELGGRYVTFGSDAHTPSAIGINFNNAMSFAQTLNLTPVYFKERKLQIVL
jgi:histidinol-phosphatase (PHP family)